MEALYTLRGTVVHGRGMGHRFGMPTANLQGQFALPPEGVYIASVLIAGKRYIGVTNVGLRPTLDHETDVTVETHLLDYAGDLYGQELTVTLHAFLRAPQRFDSVEALHAQVERDGAAARAFFKA